MSDKKRILLVDDSKFVRTTFRLILSRAFNVLEADDGEAGWEALQANPDVVLVFSDLQMPKLDGYGLLERMRKDPRLQQIPVIVISGKEDEASRKKARAAGASDFISKNADGTEILTRLENVLKLVHARPAAAALPADVEAALKVLQGEGARNKETRPMLVRRLRALIDAMEEKA